MGMSNYILDCVEEFWSKAHKTIGGCETVSEWEAMMKPHEHLLKGSEDEEHLKDCGYDGLWNDYWSDVV